MRLLNLTGVLALAMGVLSGVQPAAAQTLVYSEDFDGGTTVAPGVGASLPEAVPFTIRQSVGNFAGYGPSGNQISGQWLRTGGTTAHSLTLTNLPAHSKVSVSFLLGILDSWDSERFTVEVDGVNKFDDTFHYFGQEGNAATNSIELATNIQGPGGSDPAISTAYNFGAWPSLQDIPHTGSSLTVTLKGFTDQGFDDESWGMDNLRVSIDSESAVPEPGALFLFLPALGVMALLKRSRLRPGQADR